MKLHSRRKKRSHKQNLVMVRILDGENKSYGALKAFVLLAALLVIALSVTGKLTELKEVRLVLGGLLASVLIYYMRGNRVLKVALIILLWLIVALMYFEQENFWVHLVLALLVIVLLAVAWRRRPIPAGEDSGSTTLKSQPPSSNTHWAC